MVIWCIPIILVPIVENIKDDDNHVLQLIIMTALFYFNLYFLYPKYLAKKKVFAYIAFAACSCIVASLVYNVIQYYLYAAVYYGPFMVYMVLETCVASAFIGISTMFKTISESLKEKRLKQRRENENLKTELSFLRSQVSPHFMFNVLNGIVALIRQKSDKLEPTVIELSKLMRYMLYESDEKKVSLKTEIEYLKSYIDLQMLRFGNKTDILFDIRNEMPDKHIEPMLLIPLVENAFKHGTNVIEKPFIHITLHFEKEGLHLNVKNKCRQSHKILNGNNSGIGLNNLQRRLNLLYPGSHELVINKENNLFDIFLHLNMKT